MRGRGEKLLAATPEAILLHHLALRLLQLPAHVGGLGEHEDRRTPGETEPARADRDLADRSILAAQPAGSDIIGRCRTGQHVA